MRAVVESLEGRALLSTVTCALDPLNPGQQVVTFTEQGGHGSDKLTLRLNGAQQLTYSMNGSDYTADLDSTQSGVQALPISAISRVVVALGNGSDTLNVDNSKGLVSPSSGITFDNTGGTGTDTFVTNLDTSFAVNDAGLTRGSGSPVTFINIGRVRLTGGPGNDTFNLTGWSGTASLTGSSGGTDTLVLAQDTNFTLADNKLTRDSGGPISLRNINVADLTGGASNNTFDLSGWSGGGTIVGGGGADSLVVYGVQNALLSDTTLIHDSAQPVALSGIGSATLAGCDGNVSINASAFSGSTNLSSGEGNSTLIAGQGSSVLSAGEGNNTLIGGAGDAVISAGEGNNYIRGGGGNDTITTGDGNQVVYGGNGNNTIRVGNGNNFLYGGPGNDAINWGDGNTVVSGGAGYNVLNGGRGRNRLTESGDSNFGLTTGTSFTDTLAPGPNGTTTIDVVVPRTSFSSVVLAGGAGNNTFDVNGYLGAATLIGNGGSDTVATGTASGSNKVATNPTTGVTTMTVAKGGPFTLQGINNVGFAGNGSGGNFTIDASAFTGNFSISNLGTGNDTVIGSQGNNTFNKSYDDHGHKTFIGGPNQNTFNIGPGSDVTINATASTQNMLSFANAQFSGVTFDATLTQGQIQNVSTIGGVTNTVAFTGTLTSLVGSPLNDTITGAPNTTVSSGGGNDTFLTPATGGANMAFDGGSGNATLVATAGTVSNLSFSGSGNNVFITNGASVTNVSFAGTGADQFIANGGSISNVSFAGNGADSFLISGSNTVVNNVSFNGGSGADAFIVSGGAVTNVSFTGGSIGAQFIANGGSVTNVSFNGSGTGFDQFIANGAAVTGVSFNGGNGGNQFISNGPGAVTNVSFNGGLGNDAFIGSSGTISNVSFNGGSSGVDQFISNGAAISNVSFSGTGTSSDVFIANGGSVTTVSFNGGNGGDAFIANGATLVTNVSFNGGLGNDAFIGSSGTISNVSFNGGGLGNDQFIGNGAAISNVSFNGGLGNDAFIGSSGTISNVSFNGGGAGNDFFITNGALVTNVSFVGSGTAFDQFISNGGSVTGVSFSGGDGGNAFIANGATSVTNVSFNGGLGNDAFIGSSGTISNVSFNGGSNGFDQFIANGGSVTNVSFAGTGTSSDVFIANGSSVSSVSFNGGNGGDAFISNGPGAVTNVSFNGGSGNDAFIANGPGPVTNVSFNGGGTGNDVFISNGSGVTNVSFVGGTGNDAFIANGPGLVTNVSFNGGSGNDAFIANSGAVTNVSFTGTGADQFIANGASVTNVSFTGTGNGPDAFIANGGYISSVSFAGGSGGDQFIANGAITVTDISFTGGLGNDAFFATSGTVTNVSFNGGGAGNDQFIANGVGTAVANVSFVGGAGNDAFFASTTGGSVSNVNFNGGSGFDAFIANGGSVTNVSFTGTGADQFIANGAAVTGVSFNGGNGGDAFITNGGSVTNVSFNGGNGNDTFLASNGTSVTNVSFTGGAGTDRLVVDGAILNNATFDGSGGSSDLVLIRNGASATGLSFTGGTGSDAFEANGAAVSSFNFTGGSGTNALVLMNATAQNGTFVGGPNPDVFVQTGGTATGMNVNTAGGDDQLTVGGSFNGTLAGGAGNDTYTFFGQASGNVTIAEYAQAGTDNSVDTLDFSPLQTGGVNIDISSTSPQAVAPGLSLTLADAAGIENVTGTRFNDTIHGNSRPNVLLGSALPDSRNASASSLAPAASTQYVLVTFLAPDPGSNDTAYTPDMQSQVLAGLKSLYAPYGFVQFTTDPGQIPAGTQFATLTFNKKADPGTVSEPGGVSNQLDFRNTDLGGAASIEINGFLGGQGQPPNTTANFIAASIEIGAHELGHMLGLEHLDAYGPIGYGVGVLPGPDSFNPSYPGWTAAFESNSHVIASPGAVGSTLADAVSGTWFGEREAIKLAFDEFASKPGNSGTVVNESTSPHGTTDTAQSLALVPIPVPNVEPAGSYYSGMGFNVAAVDVLGSISAAGEADYYSIDGKQGDLLNLEIYSQNLQRPTPLPDGIVDSVISVYDSSGHLIKYYSGSASNDDQNNNPATPSADARIFDLRLPADGKFFIKVSSTDAKPTGDYELFINRFSAYNLTSGNDTLIGGSGNATIIGGPGNDTITPGSGTNIIDGGGGVNTLTQTGDASYVLTNNTLDGIGHATFTNINNVVLTGGTGADSFTLNGFTGNATLIGNGASDTYSVGIGNGVQPTVLIADSGPAGTLSVIGDGSLGASYVPSATTPGAGTVAAGSSQVTFTGLQSVSASLLSSLAETTPGNQDTVQVSASTPGSNTITGTSDGVALTPLNFSNVTSFTLDTGANDQTASSVDVVTISPPGFVALGLQNVTINMGPGVNMLNVPSGLLGLPVAGGSIQVNSTGAGTVVAQGNATNLWNLSGTNGGTFDGVLAFSGFGNLVGGPGNDVFAFADGANVTGSIKGGGGFDWLNYSAYTSPIAVNLSTGKASGVGQKVSGVENVVGGAGNDSLTGDASNNVLIGGPGNDTIVGGSADNILIGGLGADRIINGSDESIVIGGYTDFDTKFINGAPVSVTNYSAFQAIMAEWGNESESGIRFAHLSGQPGGANGSYFLTPALPGSTGTVHDDFASNVISGSYDTNWIFLGVYDQLTDPYYYRQREIITRLFYWDE